MQHSVHENESNQLPKVLTEAQEARVREIIQEEIQKAKVEELDAVNEE